MVIQQRLIAADSDAVKSIIQEVTFLVTRFDILVHNMFAEL